MRRRGNATGMTPAQFVRVDAQALLDLQMGMKMETGESLKGPLVARAPAVYSTIEKYIGDLAATVFDDSSGVQVRQLMGW